MNPERQPNHRDDAVAMAAPTLGPRAEIRSLAGANSFGKVFIVAEK